MRCKSCCCGSVRCRNCCCGSVHCRSCCCGLSCSDGCRNCCCGLSWVHCMNHCCGLSCSDGCRNCCCDSGYCPRECRNCCCGQGNCSVAHSCGWASRSCYSLASKLYAACCNWACKYSLRCCSHFSAVHWKVELSWWSSQQCWLKCAADRIPCYFQYSGLPWFSQRLTGCLLKQNSWSCLQWRCVKHPCWLHQWTSCFCTLDPDRWILSILRRNR